MDSNFRLFLSGWPLFLCLALAQPGHASLALYDATISDDEGGAGLVPVAKSTSATVLNGSNSGAFDFGANSGAVTMEFIVEGDPQAGGRDGFLAVGANSSSSLRYEQWDDTGQLGFTQGGVADYLFSPLVLSPTDATHVTYVWDGDGRMDLYLDGTVVGQATGVSGAFSMPSGNGFLGNNSAGSEGMVGTIHRVTVYNEAIDPAAIKRHADAYNDVTFPPTINGFTASPSAYVAPGSSVLTWSVLGADALSINGTDVSALSQLSVSPAATTVYTLTATNGDGSVTRDLTVTVNPAPVITSFSADRSTVNSGESTTLSWETEFATGWVITPSPGDVSGMTSAGAGSATVSPVATTSYRLTASNPAGEMSTDFTVSVAMVATHPVISEFMADNETALADGDGDYSDWIEIYNPTGTVIDLAGYYLTDDAGDLTQWMFPAHLLAPGARVV
ncbi:MAG: LamG-like jellyroll fold domain-containing protein, partial [Verrucomicrobiales bacterium]